MSANTVVGVTWIGGIAACVWLAMHVAGCLAA